MQRPPLLALLPATSTLHTLSPAPIDFWPHSVRIPPFPPSLLTFSLHHSSFTDFGIFTHFAPFGAALCPIGSPALLLLDMILNPWSGFLYTLVRLLSSNAQKSHSFSKSPSCDVDMVPCVDFQGVGLWTSSLNEAEDDLPGRGECMWEESRLARFRSVCRRIKVLLRVPEHASRLLKCVCTLRVIAESEKALSLLCAMKVLESRSRPLPSSAPKINYVKKSSMQETKKQTKSKRSSLACQLNTFPAP